MVGSYVTDSFLAASARITSIQLFTLTGFRPTVLLYGDQLAVSASTLYVFDVRSNMSQVSTLVSGSFAGGVQNGQFESSEIVSISADLENVSICPSLFGFPETTDSFSVSVAFESVSCFLMRHVIGRILP